MFVLVSIVMVAVTVFGAEWVVDHWLGEGQRYWIALAGLALVLLASAILKASGIEAMTSTLRKLVIGAGIGAALRRIGLKLPWLRRGLRMFGIETEPETQAAQDASRRAMQWSAFSNALLLAGWAGSMVGLGMIWIGFFAG